MDKINQTGHGWGGNETWRGAVNTEQLALLPRISPSGLLGFLF